MGIKSIRFDSTECGRCSGTGSHGPRSVQGGVCMQCKGGKRVLTRAGKAARLAYDAALDTALNTALDDIAPGALVWSDAHRDIDGRTARYAARWRTVASVTVNDNFVYTVTFEDGKKATLSGKGDVGSSGLALRVFDNDSVQRVFAHIVDRFQGAKAAAR